MPSAPHTAGAQGDGIPRVQPHDSLSKRLEYRMKRGLLWLMRQLAGRTKPPVTPLDAHSKVLFIRLNRIGDALITTALIHAVREHAGCTIHVYADSKNRFIFDGHPDVDAVHTFRKKLRDFWRFRALCRHERYDAVVDCHDDVSTTVTYLVTLSGAPYRIGLFRPGNHHVFTHTYPRHAPAKTHVLDRLLQLTQAFGFTLGATQGNVHYPISQEKLAAAKAVLQGLYPVRGFVVGINLTAGSEARFWGIEHFRQLVAALQNEGCQVVLMGLPSDAVRAREIAAHVPFYYNSDFAGFSALIPQLDLFFTPDTSLVHVASAYQVPVVALYVHANTDLMYWYPYRSAHVAITTQAHTIADLPFETVWAQTQPFLTDLQAATT